MRNTVLSGTKRPDARRKSKTFEKGRVCATDGCTVTLSMYNKKKWCFNHAPLSFGRNRGWVDPTKKKS
jgi:hypothetical protein